MASAVGAKKFSIPTDHFEQFSRTLSNLTIDPYKYVIYTVFPIIGALFSNAQKLSSDKAQQGMMPIHLTPKILEEIKNLCSTAGIKREIIPYAGLNYHFSSYGGSWSITDPILFVPFQHLFRPDQTSFPCEESKEDSIWTFTNDEIRFFIARELAQIKGNDALLRIATKVAVLAATIAIFAAPLSFGVGLGLMLAVMALYIISERFFQGHADRDAIEILTKHGVKDPQKSAISALEKMRQQNLHHREESTLARWYTSEAGNNFVDLVFPLLTSRLDNLKESAPGFPDALFNED